MKLELVHEDISAELLHRLLHKKMHTNLGVVTKRFIRPNAFKIEGLKMTLPSFLLLWIKQSLHAWKNVLISTAFWLRLISKTLIQVGFSNPSL